ncbi:DUF4139 domain-containing protein [Magnetospirillum sp. UT-4]|uniref:DUF4139 domain-containing protein n=1 Tax=Magnetospirillum sp. UT-4 TaxID=2681467 RepID=UPI0013811FCB|nr:DUF4139 domain-containing protein [Magnetospirillum sp. UT-4]CAA7624404.1 conserved exported hypothetical protein [Magnetospirillum sp. UT-4]
MARPHASILACAALLGLAVPAAAADGVATVADRTGLAVTITQDGTALVRDRREATLAKGAQALVFEGVAGQATGVGSLSGAGVRVDEQGFDPGGIEAGSLLRAAVGREVTVVWSDGTAPAREERAVVLAAGPLPVFQVAGRVVAGQPARIHYDALPQDMRPLAAYRAAISAEAAGRRPLDLVYQTLGLGWSAETVAELPAAGDGVTLSVWAAVANHSGIDLPRARLQLVAGETNRVADAPPPRALMKVQAAAAMAPEAAREALGPYHLYTVAQPVSLRDGETRQVPLVAPVAVAAERRLVLDPVPPYAWRQPWTEGPALHPAAQLELRNTSGVPLPGGTVRVVQRGADGGVRLLGEDRLPATPAGATARITLGKAFDLTARRSQVDFQKVSAEVSEAAFEIKLANAAAKAETVTVREAFGGDWLVVDESAKHAKENAFTARWTVTVPAKGEVVLKYRVRVKG